MNINKVTLVGNLTKAPELRTTPSGTHVCSFGMAINRTWFDKNTNSKKEEVEFVNVVAWGKTGELIVQYMVKGQQIYIEGRLHTSSYENKSGIKVYKTEVICENMQFGAKPQGYQNDPAKTSPPRQEVAPSDDFEAGLIVPPASQEQSVEDINVADIPF